ncbi:MULTISPECIES: TIGR01777 family oxidoreductase [Rhodococcus]|uniref:TIGR01777 family oxidoreductase n=1 Tax=Rhodococcus TaxID=1827 RepID=UPI0002D23528|nr:MULTISPECIES: TIGR01777 family oxidoreductase [Rhodococcus]AKE87965.1 nucleoside-diphosphate sugar epimerase [Rhodococcus aetherivorans]ANZ27413.1 TIGR01777 family protein [Rhodococcus sp. WB1]KDE11492.1 nucleoside-diphosphate sugar epimerase [Rhodococcus aetherivorans]MBC2590373.1 TIGR01777 family protein [Rhodococcus aetherivorans]MDV6293402.1 TIGR01777 family oxidoreductase [Rhodococcus aetherivorans]
MGITYSSVVDAPRRDVFDWHSRPGAVRRLLPPWQPLRVITESDSLESGRAVLGLPGGLRWIADHQPDAYDPPARFVDSVGRDGLTSLPAGIAVSWRHEHTFEALGDRRTRVTDRVDTPVPEQLLKQTFLYRHRQLADDLAAHQWSHEQGVRPATVAVTGTSGLVGTALTAYLSTGGYHVVSLVRGEPRGDDERRWDPNDPAPDLLEGIDAVVHLAGASISGRFSDAHKTAIRDSRIEPTRLLADLAARTPNGPATFVSASAIGFYGYDRGDEPLTEDAQRGTGFLADVVADWEAATAPAAAGGLRVVLVRTGIVQTPRGGPLQLQRPLFEAGLGGRLGTGRQWLSWIDLDDLLDVYHRALADPRIAGPINAVAPEPVRNDEYTRTLARVLHRPALLPVPGFGPRLLLGEEGAREVATADQCVVPRCLVDHGHRFRRPKLEACLRHQLGHIVENG